MSIPQLATVRQKSDLRPMGEPLALPRTLYILSRPLPRFGMGASSHLRRLPRLGGPSAPV